MTLSVGRHALVGAGLGFAVVALALAGAIASSGSSTAAIGYVFLPFYALGLGALPGALLGACVGVARAEERFGKVSRSAALVVVVSAGLCGAGYVIHGAWLTFEVQRVATLDASRLVEAATTGVFANNRFLLGAVAQNPAAPSALLHDIAKRADPALHKAMGSFFPVMGNNRKGLATLRLVARHPSVAPETLELLVKSPDDYVVADAAMSPKLKPETVAALASANSPRINRGLALNPATPPDVLLRLSASTEFALRLAVAGNPSTPEAALTKLREDSDELIRRAAKR